MQGTLALRPSRAGSTCTRVYFSRAEAVRAAVRSKTAVKVYAQVQRAPRPPPPPPTEKFQMFISGPPSADPPKYIMVENPLTAVGEVLNIAPRQPEGITISLGRAQAREQLALLQARNAEVRELRAALLAEQAQRHEMQARYNDLLVSKDKQLHSLHQIATTASSERGALRAEYVALSSELRQTQSQVQAYTQSLLQFQGALRGLQAGDSGASAKIDELLQAGAAAAVPPAPVAAAGAGAARSSVSAEGLSALVQQLHELSSVLVADMRRDQEALSQGLAGLGGRDVAPQSLVDLASIGDGNSGGAAAEEAVAAPSPAAAGSRKQVQVSGSNSGNGVAKAGSGVAKAGNAMATAGGGGSGVVKASSGSGTPVASGASSGRSSGTGADSGNGRSIRSWWSR